MRRLILSALSCIITASAEPHPAAEYIPKFERNLKENIVPFWLDKSIDTTNGGYIINHDAAGKPNSQGTKGIVTHANIWKGGYHNGRAMLEALQLLRSGASRP